MSRAAKVAALLIARKLAEEGVLMRLAAVAVQHRGLRTGPKRAHRISEARNRKVEHVPKEDGLTWTSLHREIDPTARAAGCVLLTKMAPIALNRAAPGVGPLSACQISAAVDRRLDQPRRSRVVLVILGMERDRVPAIGRAIAQGQEALNRPASELDVPARVVEIDPAATLVPRSRDPELVDPEAVDLRRVTSATSSAFPCNLM